MIHFEQTLPAARGVIQHAGLSDTITGVLVLRDLRGRIRLFLKPRENQEEVVSEKLEQLRADLAKELEPFWGGVVDLDRPRSEFFRILESVRSEARPVVPAEGFANWSIIERHVSKSAWTSLEHRPPWPLNQRTPPIVAWYSHKGGVGRTTALCAAAVHLARQGQRVVVIDLDLEAPGLSSVLAPSGAEFGGLDYLLEATAAGQSFAPPIADYVTRQNDPTIIGDGGEPILCVAAGVVNEHYIEKLARLDYELLAESAIAGFHPLAELLKHLKREFKPDYVFLDCRAGLHDLGGLAVHVFSHASVVFGLDSTQSWQGLRCLIRRLGQVEGMAPPACLIVQAMEDGTPGPRRDGARERFLEESYKVFCEEYYEENSIPNIVSTGEPHDPFPLAYDSRLAGFQSLRDATEVLQQPPYSEFFKRIADLVGRARTDATL